MASSLVTNAILVRAHISLAAATVAHMRPHPPQICECFVADPRRTIKYDSVDGWGDIPPTHRAIHILSLGRSTSVPDGITDSFMSEIVYNLIELGPATGDV